MNYVDLGLPSGTLWSDCNVGAEKPEDFGDYSNFDDAQKCGTLPARWQMCELVDCTQHEVCEVEGVKGMRFTGKKGNSIFMPFAGYLNCGGSLTSVGYCGYWWSCTPDYDCAYNLYISIIGSILPSDSGFLAYGQSVRLIKNK